MRPACEGMRASCDHAKDVALKANLRALAPALKTASEARWVRVPLGWHGWGMGILLMGIMVTLTPAQATVAWQVPTRGVSVASDPSNAVFTIDYEQTLGSEISVTKRDVNGNLLWTTSFDQTDPTKWERAEWVASDSQGNAVVAGTLMSGFSNPVQAASILMKFAPDGTFLWRQVYESSFDGTHTRRCLVGASDEIYVFGTGFGTLGLVSKVKKFSANGTPLWSFFDTDGIGAPLHAKFTPQGNLLLIGRGTAGSVNGYAMIDPNGNRLFGIGGVTSTTVGDAATNSLGQTYLVNAQTSLSGGTALRKIDANGQTMWQQNFPMSAFRVEVGPDDAPILSGFPTQGSPGAAFMKVDPNGQTVWSNMDADGPQALLLHAHMLIDSSGDAYLAASTLFQMAVCKVRANGTSASTVTLPGSGAQAIAFANDDGGLYVVGGYTARILDPEEGPWTDLGGGLAGTGAVTPHLYGTGSLTAGSLCGLHLEFARPNAVTVMVIGFQQNPVTLFGGVLIPSQDYILTTPTTNAAGRFSIPFLWPAGVPSGLELFVQAAAADSGAIQGVAASNALKARTP